MPKPLEEVLATKVQPVVEEAMRKYLGISINEIKGDISDRIKSSPLLGIPIDFQSTYKKAKTKFKQVFMERALQLHYGNVSEVARITGLNRRTIHRILDKQKTKKIRKDLFKPYYLRQQEVEQIIYDVLSSYQSAINQERLTHFYEHTPKLSKDITNELPTEDITLKDAELEFDKQYFTHHYKRQTDIKELAKKIDLSYETTLRKLKKLQLL